jgi:FAD/FMN-containing dehydrogenase
MDLIAAARAAGIDCKRPDELPRGDFRVDPGLDFGRLERRDPALVLRPATPEQLAASLRLLADAAMPYKIRGAAHSPGGEVLSDGGAVVDLAGLAGIVDEADDEITVLGGTTYLEMWEQLARRGRRPLGLTTNPRVTVAGSLSVGGVGDAAHRNGAQVAHVRRLALVTPRGDLVRVAPGDPLFDHALCGHGQLGAIAEVTLATWDRSPVLTGRLLRWERPEAFLADAAVILDSGRWDYFRGRLEWRWPAPRVWALLGQLGAAATAADAGVADLRPLSASPVERFDLLRHARVDLYDQWQFIAPCVELVYPFPDGLDAFRRADRLVAESGLTAHLPRGSSLMLLPGTRGLPLSPFPAPRNLVFVIRPEPTRLEDAHACRAPMERLAEDALAAGGRVYLSSFPLAGAALERQLGAAAATLPALKDEVDPRGLCNRGNLFGWRS